MADWWKYSGPQNGVMANSSDESAEILRQMTQSQAVIPEGYAPPTTDAPELETKPAPKSVKAPKAQAKPAKQTAPDNVVEEAGLADLAAEPPPPRMKEDWSADVARANDAATQDRNLAAIQRGAEGLTAAFYPGMQDHHASDAIAARAGSHMKGVDQNRQMEEMALKARSFNEANDPNSASNRQFRALIAKEPGFSTLVKNPAFQKMTKAKLEPLLGINQKERESAQKKHHEDNQDRAAWVTANRMTLGKGENGKTAGQQAVDDRYNQSRLDKMGEFNSKRGEVLQAMKNIDAIVPGASDGKLDAKAFPLGVIEKAALRMPRGAGEMALANNPQAAKLYKAMNQFNELLLRKNTGAVINKDELEQYKSQFSGLIFSSPEGFSEALKAYKALFYRSLKEKMLSYGEGALREGYDLSKHLKGSNYKDEYFRSVGDEEDFQPLAPQSGSAQAGSKQIVDSVYSTKRNKTKITYSDGTVEIVDGKR